MLLYIEYFTYFYILCALCAFSHLQISHKWIKIRSQMVSHGVYFWYRKYFWWKSPCAELRKIIQNKKKMLGKRGITARKNAADRLEVIKRPMSVIKRRSWKSTGWRGIYARIKYTASLGRSFKREQTRNTRRIIFDS